MALLVLTAAPFASLEAHDWYPPVCCHGTEQGGDCRRVRAWIGDEGHWWIRIKELGGMKYQVPDGMIRKQPIPPDQACHACYTVDKTTHFIYFHCFFPCGAEG